MAMKNMRRGMPNLFKSGTKHLSGAQEAVGKNIEACKQLSKITASSFGPNGMNKIVINHLERVFVTSDAATIIREMEVVHPAAKMLVLASEQQEREMGDGSNFVVIFAGELLSMAESLLRMGLHPQDVVRGYTLACEKAMEALEGLVCYTETDFYNEEKLAKACTSAIGAKQYGYHIFLSKLVAKACATVMPKKNPKNFNVDNVRVTKFLGGSLERSEVINGVVVVRPVESATLHVEDAKVAVFNETIDVATTETKGTVLLKSDVELLNYNEGEEKMLEKIIKSIADLGAKVVISGGKISDMAMHFIDKYNMLCVRINSKFELRRLAKTLGARINLSLKEMRPDDLGYCSKAFQREVGSAYVTVFEHEKRESPVTTILLRGGTTSFLTDIERAVDDGVNVVKALARDARVIPGAGATEIELAAQVSSFADRNSGLEQYAIKKFAEALEVFPRMLASNAGMISNEIISKLYSAHERGDTSIGIDIEGQDIGDITKAGIYDILPVKREAIRLACDTACTVLRVDQIIMAKPAGGPKMGQKKGHWDDDDD